VAAEQKSETYRVRIRRADVDVEVEAPDAAYVDAKVAELLDWMGVEALPSLEDVHPRPESAVTAAGKPPSLVEFVRSVRPNGGLEHVLVVGYYLEQHRGATGGFRRRDLAQAFKTLRYNHSNPGVPIAAGRRQGLLMDGAEVDKTRLSESADQWVRARLRGE
jgi:hypothetical protein